MGVAAPIFRYGDQRLLGNFLVSPFKRSYSLMKPLFFHPVHSNSWKAIEYPRRIFGAVLGVTGIVISTPFALVGRTFQILHYHALSTQYRDKPTTVKVRGISLPILCKKLDYEPKKTNETYRHGTKIFDNNKAVNIALNVLRNGFDPSKTSIECLGGNAAYISKSSHVSKTYGDTEFEIHLDLDSREVADIKAENSDSSIISRWKNDQENNLKNHLGFWNFFYTENMFKCLLNQTIQDLFLANGYRGLEYDLWHEKTPPAIAVYDPSCIGIKKINEWINQPQF